MDKNTEFHILVATPDGQKYFWDSYRYQDFEEILSLLEKNGEVLGFVMEDDARGYHVCEHSALYEDLTGYVDDIQEGDNVLLDSEKYIVCWYDYAGNEELIYRVDFGLSKDEILENVKAGKYVEGAFYIPVEKMFSLEDIEKEMASLDGVEEEQDGELLWKTELPLDIVISVASDEAVRQLLGRGSSGKAVEIEK